jgi:hypothetical protein
MDDRMVSSFEALGLGSNDPSDDIDEEMQAAIVGSLASFPAAANRRDPFATTTNYDLKTSNGDLGTFPQIRSRLTFLLFLLTIIFAR